MSQELQRTIPPIVLTRQESLTPHTYRLVITTTHCTGCGSLNETSELYQINALVSRWGLGKRSIINSIPCDRFLWNVPLQIRHTMKLKSSPVCYRCYKDVSLNHLPTVPSPEPEIVQCGAKPSTSGASGTNTGGNHRKTLTVDDI